VVGLEESEDKGEGEGEGEEVIVRCCPAGLLGIGIELIFEL
jgi:hypothetical protein